MRTNPRLAIVTKNFVNKTLKFAQYPTDQSPNLLIDKEANRIGLEVQKTALKYFQNVDIFPLDELYNSSGRNLRIFDNYDFIIPVGGDGTFLSCAYFIPNNKKVIFGINSDPKRSLGFLLEMKYGENFEKRLESVFQGIQSGNFELFHRKRFLVNSPELKRFCENNHGQEQALIGLNDLFFGNYNQAQTSRYHFRFDGERVENVRSTGCLIYTGSGSSAWAYGMNKIPDQTMEYVLEYLEKSKEELKGVQKYVQDKFTFPPKIQKLAFKHREPTILNGEFMEQGYGKSFGIVNLSHEGCVAVDGFEYLLGFGETLDVDLAPVDQDLLCLKLNSKEIGKGPI